MALFQSFLCAGYVITQAPTDEPLRPDKESYTFIPILIRPSISRPELIDVKYDLIIEEV